MLVSICLNNRQAVSMIFNFIIQISIFLRQKRRNQYHTPCKIELEKTCLHISIHFVTG